MSNDRKNGKQLMDQLAQMRRRLAELESFTAEHPRSKEIERLLADLRDANEQLVIATIENLDRAKTAAAQAETERLRLSAVLKLTPAGVLIAEAPSGKVILVNEQVERLWRRPLPPMASVADYRDLGGFRPDGRPYAPEEWPLARSLQKGEEVREKEIAFLRGDGTRGTLLAGSTPLLNRKGRIVEAVMVLHDITERKQAAERLAGLQAAISALSEVAAADQVAEALLSRAMRAVGASAGSMALLAGDGQTVEMVGDVCYPKRALTPFRRSPIGTEIPIVEAVRTGQAIFLGSVEEGVARFPNLKGLRTGHQSFAAVPMRASGRTVGALGFSFLEPRRFLEEERAFMETLAQLGAQALERIGPARAAGGAGTKSNPGQPGSVLVALAASASILDPLGKTIGAWTGS